LRTLAAALGVALGMCVLLLAPPQTDRAAALAVYRIGDTVMLPTLETPDGTEVALQDVLEGRPEGAPRAALVIEFWSARCPVSRGYQTKVEALRDAYAGQGVDVVAVTARPDESRAEILARVGSGTAPPLLLIDSQGRLAGQLGIRTTPHFAVLDASGTLVYSGAFDSNLIERPDDHTPHHTYLRDALDELLAERPVTVSRTRAFGTPLPRPARAAASSPSPRG
jgi:hypothetical protein